MVDFNEYYPFFNRDRKNEEDHIRDEVIKIVKELSEEDLYYFKEILQLTLRT